MADENPEEELRRVQLERERYALRREIKEGAERERREMEEDRKKRNLGGRTKTAVAAGAGLMGGLAVGGFGKAKKHGGTIFVILAFLLFLFDTIVVYKGFNITSIDSFFELFRVVLSLGYVIGVWTFFYFFISKDRSFRAIISFIAVLIILIISTAIAFRLNPIAIFHIIFIVILWFFFIRQREDAAKANWFLIGLLFADLYLYSFINIFSPDIAEYFIGVPILFFLTLAYIWEQTNNKLALILMIGVVGWYFIMGGPALAAKLDLAGIEGVKEKFPSWGEIFEIGKKKIVEEPIQKIRESTSAWISGQIEYAITGKIEENQYEPLGVYLERVQSAETKYYEDEAVIVWGTVKARTLDDQINIKIGCYAKSGEDKIPANKVDPEKSFSVFALEEQDFACTFNGGVLKEGSNTITTFADFNFETLAYLKTYFIDNERKRAMTREGIEDILEEFKIKDKEPVAVYTNGPVEIGMETTTPLIGVRGSYADYPAPTLSISLKNREGWQGEITKLNGLILFFPEGVELEATKDDEGNELFDNESNKLFMCSNKEFRNSTPGECQEELCNKDTGTDCQKACESANMYSLVVEEDYEPLDFIRCKFNPSKVLENTPITTKFFRVTARYDYTVEKPVTVNIEALPDELKREVVEPPTPTSSDEVTEILKFIENRYGIFIPPKEDEAYYRHFRDVQFHTEDSYTVEKDEVFENADLTLEDTKIFENVLKKVPYAGKVVQIMVYHPPKEVRLSSTYFGKFWKETIGPEIIYFYNLQPDEKSLISIGYLKEDIIVHEIGHAIEDAIEERFYEDPIVYRNVFFNRRLFPPSDSPILNAFAKVTGWEWEYDTETQDWVNQAERRMPDIVEDFAESFKEFFFDPSDFDENEKLFFENLDNGLRENTETFLQQIADNPTILLEGIEE